MSILYLVTVSYEIYEGSRLVGKKKAASGNQILYVTCPKGNHKTWHHQSEQGFVPVKKKDNFRREWMKQRGPLDEFKTWTGSQPVLSPLCFKPSFDRRLFFFFLRPSGCWRTENVEKFSQWLQEQAITSTQGYSDSYYQHQLTLSPNKILALSSLNENKNVVNVHRIVKGDWIRAENLSERWHARQKPWQTDSFRKYKIKQIPKRRVVFFNVKTKHKRNLWDPWYFVVFRKELTVWQWCCCGYSGKVINVCKLLWVEP